MGHAASCLLTSLHAGAASVGADLAMLMLAGVPLTLVPAEAAGGSANVQHPADDFLIGARSARREAAGDVAYVGAVEV